MSPRYQPVLLHLDGHTYPGQLLGWRWTDQQQKAWTGCVRYRGARGLQYEGWFPGATIRPDPSLQQSTQSPATQGQPASATTNGSPSPPAASVKPPPAE